MIEIQADHSGQLGPTRYQGVRPTCLAFVASDLNAFANTTGHLSVEYLCYHAARIGVGWHPSHGFTSDAILQAVAAPGQPEEASYPYLADVYDAPLNAPSTNPKPLFTSQISARNLSSTQVIDHVLSGKIVGVVLATTLAFYQPVDGIVAFDTNVIPDLYHASVLTGLGRHKASGEQHLLVRNSWGSDWGNRGYAWISEQYLRLHLVESFSV